MSQILYRSDLTQLRLESALSMQDHDLNNVRSKYLCANILAGLQYYFA